MERNARSDVNVMGRTADPAKVVRIVFIKKKSQRERGMTAAETEAERMVCLTRSPVSWAESTVIRISVKKIE